MNALARAYVIALVPLMATQVACAAAVDEDAVVSARAQREASWKRPHFRLDGDLDLSLSAVRSHGDTSYRFSSALGRSSGLTFGAVYPRTGWQPFLRAGLDLDLDRLELRDGPKIIGRALSHGATNCEQTNSYRLVGGIASRYGELDIGTDYTPMAGVAAQADGFGGGYWGSTSAFAQHYHTQTCKALHVSPTPSQSGVRLDLALGLSDGNDEDSRRGNGRHSDIQDVSISRSAGTSYLGAAIQRGSAICESNPTAGSQRNLALAIGIRQVLGRFPVSASYSFAECGRVDRDSLIAISLGYRWPRMEAALQVLRQRYHTGDQSGVTRAAFASYEWTRRWTVYGSVAWLHNKGDSSFGLAGAGVAIAPAAGSDAYAIGIGLRYRFSL